MRPPPKIELDEWTVQEAATVVHQRRATGAWSAAHFHPRSPARRLEESENAPPRTLP